MAAIAALEALKRPCLVDIHTDSQYLRNGIMSWIKQWKRNGWRTADKKPVKNVDLWQRLDAALAQHQVRWHWVKGHAGHAINERADELAREGIAAVRHYHDDGYVIRWWRALIPSNSLASVYGLALDCAKRRCSARRSRSTSI